MSYKVKSKTIDLQASFFNAGRILPFFSGYAYHLRLVKLYSSFFGRKKEGNVESY